MLVAMDGTPLFIRDIAPAILPVIVPCICTNIDAIISIEMVILKDMFIVLKISLQSLTRGFAEPQGFAGHTLHKTVDWLFALTL